MVIFTGHYGGDVVFSGHGAGGHPTAVAVVSDLLALAHGSRRVEIPSAPARVSGEFEVPHYIRFLVKDRPGIVAAIPAALAEEKINIRAIVQKPGYPPRCAAVRGDCGALQELDAAARAGHHADDGLFSG
jgi:homoserine dehydrogenase